MKIIMYVLFSLLLSLASCSKDNDTTDSGTPGSTGNAGDETWLISENEVLSGGVGKDGIPSIDVPKFVQSSDIFYMEADDLIMVMKEGDQIKGYTHPILDWHEIVNDEFGAK